MTSRGDRHAQDSSLKASARPADRACARRRRGGVGRARRGARTCGAAALRPSPGHSRSRCRLVQRLRTGDPRPQQRVLRYRAVRLRFVASPRHADVLLVTGPVTKNMREALERTYLATPDPKWVVAVGDCAVDGGMFAGGYACVGGVSAVVAVDLHIRGCPPRPIDLIKGLLALVQRGEGSGGI